MSSFNTPDDGEVALHHGDIPNKQTAIAKAVHDALDPVVYTVKAGDTLIDVARALDIMVPVSLFNVKEGQIWKRIGGFMVNWKSWTSFPIRHSANDDQFAVAA